MNGFESHKSNPNRQESDSMSVENTSRLDEGSVKKLLEKFMPDMRNFAQFLVRDAVEADDLLQRAYLRALENHESFRGNQDDFKRWLNAVVKNTFHTVTAERKVREHPSIDDDNFTESRSMATAPEQEEWVQLHDLQKSIDSLPVELAEVFQRVISQGETIQEVAQALHIHTSVVEDRLHQAQDILANVHEVPIPPRKPRHALESRFTQEELEAVLATVPKVRQEAYRLYEFEKMPYAEIAAKLNLPLGTVKTQVRRTREAIAKAAGTTIEDVHDVRNDPLRAAFEAHPNEFAKFLNTLSARERIAVELVTIKGISRDMAANAPELRGQFKINNLLKRARGALRAYPGFR